MNALPEGNGRPADAAVYAGCAAIWACFTAGLALEAFLHQRQVLSFPALERPLGPFDPDNWLYLTQTRDWLQGGWQGFFDHAVKRTDAPFGGVDIHWTRPFQALLALFYSFVPGFSADTRLMLAATWLPPCLGLGAAVLLTRAARTVFDPAARKVFDQAAHKVFDHAARVRSDHSAAAVCVCLLMLATPYREDYFGPGASDHHGLLSLLWCGVLALLMAPALSRRYALVLGALLGLMTWISLEALVLTGFVFAATGTEALFRPEKARTPALAALGAAAVAAAGLFVEVPAQQILSHPLYDTLSIAQLCLLSLSAAGAAALALLFSLERKGRPALNFGARFFAAAVTGAAVLLAEWSLYPKFFQGPFVDADPFIFTGFLPRVGELQPLWRLPAWNVIEKAGEPAIAALLLLAALFMRKRLPVQPRQVLILLALLAGALGLTLFELRWNYYLQPVAITAIAALLPLVAAAAYDLKKRPVNLSRLLPFIGPALILAAFLFHPAPPEKNNPGFNCLEQIRYVVQTQQLQPLLGAKDLVLLTQGDAGADVLFFTPYRILASNFHREGTAIRDLQRLEARATPEAARALLRARQVEALLSCPAAYEPNSWVNFLDGEAHQRSTLMGMSYIARRPAWITPVEGLRFMDIPGPRPGLYRIEN